MRKALLQIAAEPLATARMTLKTLEMGHRSRREWVWAKLNRSPLAQAIAHLATLAEATATPLSGAKLTDMVKAYTESGWRADLAVLESLAAVSTHQDREAVSTAIVHVYKPWLRDSAELFQARAKVEPVPGKSVPRLSETPPGTCLLFVDGLRFDVGQKLKEELERKSARWSLRLIWLPCRLSRRPRSQRCLPWLERSRAASPEKSSAPASPRTGKT